MLLILSLALALIPLLGIVWIVLYSSVTTVDGLFMSLILLAMSGILAMNAFFEWRNPSPRSSRRQGVSAATAAVLAAGGLIQRGKVESVFFYESNVGQPNKSIVTLSNGNDASQMLVLEGDVRNALPVGRRVEVTFRKENGQNVLMDVIYA
jgi:hypothetical protein